MSKAVNVLFLDIDGVLNSEDYYRSLSAKQKKALSIDRRCVARVRHIVDTTQAVIVLTSSWREGWNRNPDLLLEEGQILNRIFGEYGLNIYDKTPFSQTGRRPEEIRQWLEHCKEKIHRYVILDDFDFRWKEYRMYRHWVATDYLHGGLSDDQAERAIELFGRSGLYFLMERFASKYRRGQ